MHTRGLPEGNFLRTIPLLFWYSLLSWYSSSSSSENVSQTKPDFWVVWFQAQEGSHLYILFYSVHPVLGCPSTAGSRPPSESSNLFCALLSLSILFPVTPQCYLTNSVLIFQLILLTFSLTVVKESKNFFVHFLPDFWEKIDLRIET